MAETSSTPKLAVSLTKPLGLRLEENQPGTPSGVFVSDIVEGGSAFGRPAISKGMGVVKVAGTDCSEMSFDAVMQLLDAAESPIDLVLSAPTRAPAAPAAPTPKPAKQKLEGTAKFEAALNKNFGSADASKKMATKVTKTVFNAATWKNPIYFWSIAGTAILFLPIILYVVSK